MATLCLKEKPSIFPANQSMAKGTGAGRGGGGARAGRSLPFVEGCASPESLTGKGTAFGSF